jgi:DNA processing protein
MKHWKEYQIHKVEIGGSQYPKEFNILNDPPKQIYFRGALDRKTFKKSLAVIGSRNMTRYGSEVIEKFIPHFVSSQITIVSGFMYGVDVAAHSKTSEYGGITVAVLGGGLDELYPAENDELYSKILETGGAVISEYEPIAKPHLWKFPQRNRLVVALSSLGILVIEAAQKSGSLVSARIAQKYKKDIYAVPGPITSTVSEGTNGLISSGSAMLVTSPSDITKLKEISKPEVNKIKLEDPLQQKIIEVLSRQECTLDELVELCDEDIANISIATSMLSVQGIIEEFSGKFTLKR